MSRTLLAFLAATVALAAPAPKTKEVLYFPTKVGDTSVFEEKSKDAGGEKTEEITMVVTTVEAKEGGLVVSVKRDGPGTEQAQDKVRVTDKGLFYRRNGEPDFSRCSLKLPAKKGETWEVEIPTNTGLDLKTLYVVVGEEVVEVPAGKFKAIRVDSTTELPGRTAKRSDWYAPGVGMVKMWFNAVVGERTISLKSFTPGK